MTLALSASPATMTLIQALAGLNLSPEPVANGLNPIGLMMSKRDELYQNDAVWAAFYRDGQTLGEIAEEHKVSCYDLSPWLTAPLVRDVFKTKAANPSDRLADALSELQELAKAAGVKVAVTVSGAKAEASHG